MNKFKKMLPYLLIMVLNFYLLPVFIKDTGTAMVMLLVVIPLVDMVCAAVYGAKNGFSLLFCGVVAALFAPTIFIFYNSGAWPYIIEFGIVALAGNAIGMLFRKRTK